MEAYEEGSFFQLGTGVMLAVLEVWNDFSWACVDEATSSTRLGST